MLDPCYDSCEAVFEYVHWQSSLWSDEMKCWVRTCRTPELWQFQKWSLVTMNVGSQRLRRSYNWVGIHQIPTLFIWIGSTTWLLASHRDPSLKEQNQVEPMVREWLNKLRWLETADSELCESQATHGNTDKFHMEFPEHSQRSTWTMVKNLKSGPGLDRGSPMMIQG